MKRYKKILFFVTSMILLTAPPGLAAVNTGDPAPDFTLKDSYGQEQSLSSYRGKFIVLEWINHDCPFVGKHYGSGNMQRLQKKYTQEAVIWFSVSSSAPGKQGHYGHEEANRLTKEKGAAPTAVLLDFDGTVGRMYGAKTTPHIFIVDPQGLLIYQGAIDSIPGTHTADVARAANYVELTLDAAMNGRPVEISSTKSYGCSIKY